jgi:predicted transcriptional regulator
MGQLKNRRSSVEIIADILRLLRLGYASKIEITQVTQINSEQGSKYVNELLEAGVLENAEEKMGLPAFRITRKGLALLNAIESLREKLPEDGVLDILHKSKITEINIGEIYLSRKVFNQVRQEKPFLAFVQKCLDRYRKGDWGEMSSDDKLTNDRSQESGRLLLASYESQGFPEIWITTSPGREYTTIMFPDEYSSMEPLEPYSAVSKIESRG